MIKKNSLNYEDYSTTPISTYKHAANNELEETASMFRLPEKRPPEVW
jgi:hypothetical protein